MPTQSYLIRHGGHREAIAGDKKLELLSAEKIWERNIVTMTSLEILQFSFEYVLANRTFIDVESGSLASGSRLSNGNVPHVFFYRGDGVAIGDHFSSKSVCVSFRARSIPVYSSFLSPSFR